MNMHFPERTRPNRSHDSRRSVNRAQRERNVAGVFRQGRGFAMLVTIVVAALLLTSCGGGGGGNGDSVQEDRQFANNAPSARTHQPTETPSPAATSGPTVTPVPAASPETLLRAEGAPAWIAAELKGTVFTIDPSAPAPAPNLLHVPGDQRALNYAASPNGSMIAVLTAPKEPDDSGRPSLSLLMFDHDGKQTGESRALFGAAGVATPTSATPATDATPLVPTVSWSAQADRVLVSSGDGQFLIVPVNGEPQPLTIDGIKGHVRSAIWSPDGDRILLLIERHEGLGSIAIATPRDGTAMAQTIWPRSDEAHRKSVDQVAWLPGGAGVMFTQSSVRGGVPVEAQLFAMSLDGTAPSLVATAGRGGPSARIADFALSPDGTSVAYTIARPQGSDWAFHSLWIKSLEGPTVFAVPVGPVVAVSGLEWSSAGLIWRQETRDSDGATREELVLAAHDTSVHVLARTRPAATPCRRAQRPRRRQSLRRLPAPSPRARCTWIAPAGRGHRALRTFVPCSPGSARFSSFRAKSLVRQAPACWPSTEARAGFFAAPTKKEISRQARNDGGGGATQT